jgi:CheY-like chemotaxis protein
MAATAVAFVEDLLFLSKIRETAKAAGVTVSAGNLGSCVASVVEARPQAIFFDLNSRTPPAAECIRALKADPATRQIRMVGFVSHVRSDLIAAARAASCDLVLARSAFSQQLPGLLRKLASETAAASPGD